MSKHIALLLVLVLMMAVSGMPEKAVQGQKKAPACAGAVGKPS